MYVTCKNKVFFFLIFTFVCTGHFATYAVSSVKKNKKKQSNIYVVGVRGMGFFSEFLGALQHIRWYDRVKHPKLVVYWGDLCLYYEPNGFNNTYNVWEYYFEPITSAGYTPGEGIHHCYTAPDQFWITDNAAVESIDTLRLEMHALIKKYIKIKPWVLELVNGFYDKNMRDNIVIGIHLRGTDKGIETSPINPIDVIKTAQGYADQEHKKQPNKKIVFYVASDEQRLIDFAKEQLKGTVISYDQAVRSDNGEAVHMFSKNKEKEPGYFAKLGCDVLVEALLFSQCDYFVHMRSNVSIVALFFNPTLAHYQHDGYAKF
jgi:hypothetical protein